MSSLDSPKRQREEDLELESLLSKGLKMSNSFETKKGTGLGEPPKVLEIVSQFEDRRSSSGEENRKINN